MATQIADILFYIIATAIVVAQAFILRSTARGIRHADGAGVSAHPGVRRTTLEWLYAILPAVALVVLLIFSWRAMHPEFLNVRGVVPGTLNGP